MESKNVNLIFAHSRWMILELLRQPAYIVSTLAFPALFYMIFAVPESKDVVSSNLLLASFSCFANFGVLFLQFGVGIAQERSTSWYQYLRTLPLKPYQVIVARFISAYLFSFLSIGVLIVLAEIYTSVSLNLNQWIYFFLAHMILGLIFCLMGLTLGYWSQEKTALPLGNLIYLPLTFAGGLWKPPYVLPESLKSLSEYLPTRQYGEVLWAIAADTNLTLIKPPKIETEYLLGLVFYALIFLILSYIGMRKDYKHKA